ncbi:MAG TPA: hypothetical protein DC024_06955 [Clostridiales bacterium]|jgi:D-alanyl-D-alanine carboxypeptidase|nr:hypothetical protein [Clostridiales bacterium]
MDLKFLNEPQVEYKHHNHSHRLTILLCCMGAIMVAIGCIFFMQKTSVPTALNKNAATSYLSLTDSEQSSISSSSYAASSSSMSSAKESIKPADKWQLLIVNPKHALPANYKPPLANYGSIQMDSRIESSYISMKSAAGKAGINLWLSEGYRTVQAQDKLFQQEVKNCKAKGVSQADAEATAQKEVSKPGFSEHNTGLLLDFNGEKDNFKSTKAYTWLQQHSFEYGFILRFPEGKESVTGASFKPWCYRYVGKENAAKMYKSHMCLEEYVNSLQT